MCVTRMLFSRFARYEVPTCIYHKCKLKKKSYKKVSKKVGKKITRMLLSPFGRDEDPACMHTSMRARVCTSMRTLDIQLDVRNEEL